MKLLTYIILSLYVTSAFGAKAKSKSKIKPVSQFKKYQRAYIKKKISPQKFWAWLNTQNQKSSDIKRMKAHIVAKENYPVLAALYTADALQISKKPLEEKHTWAVLSAMSHKTTIPNLLGRLSFMFPPTSLSKPYAFGNDWNYYYGTELAERGKYKKAIQTFDKIQLKDHHYLTSRYQAAILHIERNEPKKAIESLRSMLAATAQKLSPLNDSTVKELNNYAKLALARIYYQNKEFKKSILFYRAVDRDSRLFYDSLSEQSWAFFVGGYPNHALGALHSIDSPFFKEQYNPEIPVLRAMIYYWMCRYEDSKIALGDFADKHADAIEGLSAYVNRANLTSDTAYRLFEDYVSGVSSASLGIPRSILGTAASGDSMYLLRDQYASVVDELNRFTKSKSYHTKLGEKLLRKELRSIRKALGSQFKSELVTLKKQYDRLAEQSEFLYVELLMSEKEQLLGRELHASSKLSGMSKRDGVIGWVKKSQSWTGNQKNEYWWDEIGFYIYDVKPMCQK